MKYQKTLPVFVSLIILSALWLTSVAYAGFAIRLAKDVPRSEIPSVPNTVTFDIYNSAIATIPVASQTFPRGEWSADYDFSKFTTIPQDMVRVKVNFTNTDTLTKDMELWVEIKLDGVIKGERGRVKNEAWALFSEESSNADDVYNKDINPKSITITGYGPIIDSSGKWVGNPTGLQGPPGPQGPQGPQGPPGPPVTTSAVCASATNQGASTCSCNYITLSRISSPCSVTSDTGSCMASSYYSPVNNVEWYKGQCCVCAYLQ